MTLFLLPVSVTINLAIQVLKKIQALIGQV